MDKELDKRLLKLEEFMEQQQQIELARKFTLTLKIIAEISDLENDSENKDQHLKNIIEYADQAVGLLSAGLVDDLRGLGDTPHEFYQKESKIKKEIDMAIKKKISNTLKQVYVINKKLLTDYEKSKEGR